MMYSSTFQSPHAFLSFLSLELRYFVVQEISAACYIGFSPGNFTISPYPLDFEDFQCLHERQHMSIYKLS